MRVDQMDCADIMLKVGCRSLTRLTHCSTDVNQNLHGNFLSSHISQTFLADTSNRIQWVFKAEDNSRRVKYYITEKQCKSFQAVERKRSRSIARRESFSGTEEDLQKFRDAVAANEKEKAVELERDIEEYALKVRELRGGRAVSPPSPARDRRAAGRPARPGRVESPSPPRRRVTTQLENLSR